MEKKMFLSSLFGRKKKTVGESSPKKSTSESPELELASDATNFWWNEGKEECVSKSLASVGKESKKVPRLFFEVQKKAIGSRLAGEETIGKERKRDEFERQQGATGSKSRSEAHSKAMKCSTVYDSSFINSATKCTVHPVSRVATEVVEVPTNSTPVDSTSSIYPTLTEIKKSTKILKDKSIYPDISKHFAHLVPQALERKEQGLYPDIQSMNTAVWIPKETPLQTVHDIADDIPCMINVGLMEATSTIKKLDAIGKGVGTAVNNHLQIKVSSFDYLFDQERKAMKDTEKATNVKKIETFKDAKYCETVTKRKINQRIEAIGLNNDRLILEKYCQKFRCYTGKIGDVVDSD